MNAILSTTAQEDRLWPELTGLVREDKLIPITGSGLLEIASAAGGSKNFYTLVAKELAQRLEVGPPQHTGERALNEVACSYLAKPRSWVGELYPQVKMSVEKLE